MSATKIEWCDITINPVVGCSKCSPGCDNCYAERFAARLTKNPNQKISEKYTGVVDGHGKWTGKIKGWFEDYPVLRRAKKPLRVFVGSMCDIFHENNTDLNIASLLNYVDGGIADHTGCSAEDYRRHTYMYLTKRPDRMLEFHHKLYEVGYEPNLWLGVTVCNQAEAEAKIPTLLSIPAAKHFVSIEPMLGPVDLSDYLGTVQACSCGFIGKSREARVGEANYEDYCQDCGAIVSEIDRSGLDWVICGGETGPGARPMHPDWVRGLRDQCAAAGTPFFFKSWGEWVPATFGQSTHMMRSDTGHVVDWSRPEERCDNIWKGISRIGKRRSGRLLDGREWSEVPS